MAVSIMAFCSVNVSLNEVSKSLPFEYVRCWNLAPSDAPLRMRAAGFHFTLPSIA